MKCPVCTHDLNGNEEQCPSCGFNKIKSNFINNDELKIWEKETVIPCQSVYVRMAREEFLVFERYENAKEENEKLLQCLNERAELVNEALALADYYKKKYEELLESPNGFSTLPSTQAKVTMLDGWNYDDPIAHPNSATGKSFNIKFSVSNISSQMTSGSNATVTFLAKKESDAEGRNSTETFWIRYRVKDKDGVILLNKYVAIQGLQVSDVSRETIELTGVVAGEHTIDFVSYN